MSLPELGEDLLQGVQIIGDRPVKTGRGAVAGGDADGDVLRVDIESGEE